MRVDVRLFATLATCLPSGGHGDQAPLDVTPDTTVGQVVATLGIPPALEALTVVNGAEVGSDHRLAEGDTLTMFPPLAGGAGAVPGAPGSR